MLTTLKTADETSLNAIKEEMAVRRTTELFLLFGMGSQFDHLIAQMLAKLGVFCQVADPASLTFEDVKTLNPTGIIVSGGPASVHSEPPPFDAAIFDAGIPTLGICLGAQMIAKHLGLKVQPAEKREFGVHRLDVVGTSPLFRGFPESIMVLESHGDRIEADPKLQALGTTENAPVAAFQSGNLYGVQYHPEVSDSEYGQELFENFCFGICGAKDRVPAEDVAKRKIAELKAEIGDKKVLLALSGGSDSSVVAWLIGKAIDSRPDQVRAVYIRGIDRPDDESYVHAYFGKLPWLDLKIVDATESFLSALRGHTAMPDKRTAMRGVYKKVLTDAAREFGAEFIAQGTLYTDISESGGGYGTGARKAKIKQHHNVGLGFAELGFKELTPLDDQVKDGARGMGRAISVPEELLLRHPFPGPGLIVRVEGEITANKLNIARKADDILIQELRAWNLYESVWQAGVIVTSSVATYTKGDDAGEGVCLEFFCVWSINGFTARPARLPWEFIERVDQRLTNEIREVASVAYRVSGKPPATIERG